MIVLADNDLILKLAQCGLLEHLGELLETPGADIYVTATAPFQLRNKSREKGISRCGNEETYDRICTFLGHAKVLPPVVDVELLSRLAAIVNIDSGEQQLFASAVELDGALLLTGDKRSLEALLLNSDALNVVLHVLTGKVVIFESVLLLAVGLLGFPSLKQKLLGNPKPDGVLRLVLRENMTQETLVDCLCSYARPFAELLAYRDRLPACVFVDGR